MFTVAETKDYKNYLVNDYHGTRKGNQERWQSFYDEDGAFDALVRDIIKVASIYGDTRKDNDQWDFMLDKKITRLKSIYVETIRMVHNKDSALLKNVDAVFSRLEEARKKRNIYIHSNWLNAPMMPWLSACAQARSPRWKRRRPKWN